MINNSFANPIKPLFKPSNKQGASLSVFYSNDMHGDLKRLAKLKTAKDTFERENKDVSKLVLSGGDMFLGADRKRNNMLVEFMNKFKLDATTLGNHEFSNTSEGLAKTLENAEFTSVCANIEVDEKNELSKRIKDKKIVKSATFMKGGHKFGIIGAAPIDSYIGKNEIENPTKVFDMKKTIEAINNEAKELEKQGVNKIILCSHIGYGEDRDLQIAKETEGIDIIIGGHTHTKVDGVNQDKQNLVMSKRNEPVLITQAGGMNEYAGFLNVEFDEKGVLKQDKILNRLVKVDDFEESLEVKDLMRTHLGENEVLTKVKGEFNPKGSYAERVAQNPLHQHFGKAMLEAFKNDGAEVAIFGAPSIRGGLNNEVTTYDVKYAMIPFNSKIGVMDLSEKDVVTLLNANREKLKDKCIPNICRASGVSLSVSKTAKNDVNGNKMFVNDIKLDNGKEINSLSPSDDKKIRVVVDEYTIMTKLPEKLSEFVPITSEQEVFINYLKNQKEISTECDNKLIFKD